MSRAVGWAAERTGGEAMKNQVQLVRCQEHHAEHKSMLGMS